MKINFIMSTTVALGSEVETTQATPAVSTEVQTKSKNANWNGKHIFASISRTEAWIARLAFTIIMTVGIALIAAITTPLAIGFGTSLTAIGTLGLLIAALFPQRKERIDNSVVQQLALANFYGGFNKINTINLPTLEWVENNKDVTIKLHKTLQENPLTPQFQIFASESDKKKEVFYLFAKTENGKKTLYVITRDPKHKDKNFIIEYDNEKIPLIKAPITTGCCFGKHKAPLAGKALNDIKATQQIRI